MPWNDLLKAMAGLFNKCVETGAEASLLFVFMPKMTNYPCENKTQIRGVSVRYKRTYKKTATDNKQNASGLFFFSPSNATLTPPGALRLAALMAFASLSHKQQSSRRKGGE